MGGDQARQLRDEAEALFAGSPAARGSRGKKEKPFFSGVQGSSPVHVLDAWWRRAETGDEFVYCEALEPIRDETWHRAGELARSGFLRCHSRKRAGGGRSWFVVRTAKRLEPSLDPAEAALADEATAIIFRALKRAANFTLPCPSNGELARAAGLDMPQKAGWRVTRLADAGLIESVQVYDGGVPRRVVTILPGKHAVAAAGKRTALPAKWKALQDAVTRGDER